MIRVLIVEDVPLFRSGLRWAIEQMGDGVIIGEATQVDSILHLAQTSHPDVVVLNENLTTAPALDITRLLLQAEQRGVFVLADRLTEEHLFECLVAGAAAYEPRWISAEDLARKLRKVSAGEYLISGETLDATLPAHQPLLLPHTLAAESNRCPLTPHEMQLLVAIAQGRSNKQIASLFALSEQVVHAQIATLLQTLGVAQRTSAVVVALRRGWLDFPRIEEDLSPDTVQVREECVRPRPRRKAPRPAHHSSLLVRVPSDTQVGYRLQTAYCGKARCKKCQSGTGHGPYWYAYETINGRAVRRYVGKFLPAEVELSAARLSR